MLIKCVFVLVCAALIATSSAMGDGGERKNRKDPNAATKEFVALAEAHLAKYKPLVIESEQAWWEASITGSDEAFKRKELVGNKLVELHSDHEMFARLKALRAQGEISDPLLRRMLEKLYRAYLSGQADPGLQKRIIKIEGDVEQLFNTHRCVVSGKERTENEVRQTVAQSADPKEVREAWLAYMSVGRKVDRQLRELVKLRNEVATQLGFRDYFAMSLFLDEVDETELLRLFDELDALTREPFSTLKKTIDHTMAARFGINENELRPWHFGGFFFQELPGQAGGPLRIGVRESRHARVGTRLLRRPRNAGRGYSGPQRFVREAGQVSACVRGRLGSCRRCADPVQPPIQSILDGYAAARTRARGVRQVHW